MREKFVITILSQLISNLLNVIAYYLLYYILNSESIGLWILMTSYINLGFVFIDLGIESIHFQYSGKKNYENYFGSFFLIKNILIILNLFFTLIIFSLFDIWGKSYTLILLALLISKILFSYSNIFIINLKSKIKIIKSEILIIFNTIGKSSAIIITCLMIKIINNPLLMLALFYMLFDSIFIISVLIVSNKEYKINKPNISMIKSYLIDSKALIIYSILSLIMMNIGNIILNYSFGYDSLAGFNLINSYIVYFLNIISGSLISLYLTYYSKFFHKNNLEKIKDITHLIEKYSSIFFISIIILVYLNGDLFLEFFFPNYVDTLPLLYLLIIIPYLHAISRPYALHMIPGGKQQIIANWDTFQYSLSIVLMIILIPNNFFLINMIGLGTVGYAYSLVIPQVLTTFAVHYFSFKYFKIKSQKLIMLQIIIALESIIVCFFIKLMLYDLIIQKYLIFIISSILALFLFYFQLILTKQLKKKDFRFMLSLFKIRNYIKSFQSELITKKDK